MIQPFRTDTVLIQGVTIINSPFWHLNPNLCNKSGRDADGRRVNVPSQNLVIQNCTFANGHGGITLGSEMTGGVKNVYARDLTMNSTNLQAGHRIKTNTLRGGYARNSNVYRITADTVGGPLMLIQGNYTAQTGDFPPDITGITLADWTVDSCEGIWSLIGASATDPVGTITLDDLTITTSTAANSAQYVSNLVVKDVTVGGTPVTSLTHGPRRGPGEPGRLAQARRASRARAA